MHTRLIWMALVLVFLVANDSLRAQALRIGVGQNTGFVMASNSRVWAWGRNNADGLLGDASTSNQISPVNTIGLNSVVAISVGQNHSLALRSDGSVLSWGQDTSGALGNGAAGSNPTPTLVSGLPNIVQIVAGSQHSMALAADGTVWIWGSGGLGQLGLGGLVIIQQLPAQIPGLTGIVRISASFQHCLAVSATGTVFGWGQNTNGQLGLGTTTNIFVPVQITSLSSIVDCSAGNDHSVFLRNDGAIFCSGSNTFGQLGNGSTVSTAIPIAGPSLTGASSVSAGFRWSLAKVAGGGVRTWGSNADGQLGMGTTGGQSTVAVVTSGLGNIIDARCGGTFGLALRSDGKVFTWGSDLFGERGNGASSGGGTAGQISYLELYPGTGEDLRLSTLVNGGVFSTGAGNDFKSAAPGDFYTVRLHSDMGDFDSVPYALVADLALTGTPPIGPPNFPVIHVSLTTTIILAPGASVGPLNQVIGTSGIFLGFQIPPGFGGGSAIFQGIALSGSANNAIFAATSAHELRLL